MVILTSSLPIEVISEVQDIKQVLLDTVKYR